MTEPASPRAPAVSEPLRFSIIVPARNAAGTIDACLASLVRQSYSRDRYEVLLVDNASTDRTASIAEAYGTVRLLSEEERGAYAARNRALRIARGSIVAFTDADCAPEEDWLARLDEAMGDAATQVVIGRNLAAATSPGLAVLGEYGHRKDTFVFSSATPALYYGRTNNMAVRRAAFDQVGEFARPPRGSDTILIRRIVDTYGTRGVRYAPAARVRHLELRRVRDHLKKYYVYGLHSHRYRGRRDRGLSRGESWRLFRETVRSEGLTAAAAARLFGLLTCGSICWRAGRATSAAGRLLRAGRTP